MKKEIHPESRYVLFHDTSVDKSFFNSFNVKYVANERNGKMVRPILIIQLMFHQLHTLFIQGNKKSLILAVEFKDLRRNSVKRASLNPYYQNP